MRAVMPDSDCMMRWASTSMVIVVAPAAGGGACAWCSWDAVLVSVTAITRADVTRNKRMETYASRNTMWTVVRKSTERPRSCAGLN